jgi:hypothetical protein
VPVSDPTSLDQVATGDDGRVLLAMTEDRRYVGADQAGMVEQFRRKLNAYVHVIRSGQLGELLGRAPAAGVDVVLYTVDEPPAAVREIIGVAEEGLRSDGVGVRWQLLPPPGRDVLLRQLAESITARLPASWRHVDLSVTLVGTGMTGSMVAGLADGGTVPVQPDQPLLEVLQGLKRALWDPQAGTWLSAHFRVDAPGRITPRFHVDAEPPADFSAADLAVELARYPRAEVPVWWEQRLTGSDPLDG